MTRLQSSVWPTIGIRGAGCGLSGFAAVQAQGSLTECACEDIEGPGGFGVLEQNQPLLLVVCSDEGQLAAVRRTLRAAGFLSTSGRSIEAALSLLTQVRVDGCVVAQPLDHADGRRLTERLEQYNPGCARVCLTVPMPEGWITCEPDALTRRLAELLR